MRLLFVHGMRQEGKGAARLRTEWENALVTVWRRDGSGVPDYELKMPYYGDLLEKLSSNRRVGSLRGDGATPSPEFALAYMEEVATSLGVSPLEFRDGAGRLGPQADRGINDFRSVMAAAAFVERRLAFVGGTILRLVTQVDAYLNVPAVREEVDGMFGPILRGERTVVVAHSLGTIVAYSVLRKLGRDADVPLFVTLGSPLGMRTVQDRLTPPEIDYPQGVEVWMNGSDKRDIVALHPRLCDRTFKGRIVNLDGFSNRYQDPHRIEDYISHPTIAAAIRAGLIAP